MRKNCVSLRKKLLHKDLNIKDSISEKTEQVGSETQFGHKRYNPYMQILLFYCKSNFTYKPIIL